MLVDLLQPSRVEYDVDQDDVLGLESKDDGLRGVERRCQSFNRLPPATLRRNATEKCLV